MACDIPLKLTVLLSFAVLLLIPLKAGVSFGVNDEMLVVPKSVKPAEIDGNWSTKTEWADASEVKNDTDITFDISCYKTYFAIGTANQINCGPCTSH